MAPPIVRELVDRFRRNLEAYRGGRYDDTQLRREFLDPFFEALGWDVYNRKGYAEAYREVIHEDAIKIGGRTKAPDYCFRVGGGVRSFFVEAKKPSIDIRDAPSPAYQLRRYAWSAKLPVSILTDFEELAVYDCRVRPAKTDKASTARVLYRRFEEYPDCWDELAGLFSPEAIRRGDLDRFIASKKVKKGTAEVDDAFLDEIESWRNDLARNIAIRNKDLSQRDLNFAVQRTIDRIVFLRICEDRGIDRDFPLASVVNGPDIYPRLAELFQRADERYNSGLFHFTSEKGRPEPDEVTLGLAVDDKVLREIIRALYYPDSPYEFSVFPAEILGQVYEQFLGKVIRLTRGHRAVVEDKPEVKKAGGVYYTPAYIVDYIVRHTVGRLLENKKPGGAAKLRILDPACGSGSFLIGAYQHLLDWHRDWYVADDPEKHARGRSPKVYRSPAGDWRLTTAERKRILVNNIYGVDIDPQAVEVTKLSLLLKVLEGESGETLETIETQRRLFHDRALPDLADNIKCGNALVGLDFYHNRPMNLFEEDEIARINAFDWQAEFPQIFQGRNPGFHAVIGNPPWGQKGFEFGGGVKEHLRETYESLHGILDMFRPFVERGVKVLAGGGMFGMVLPDIVLLKDYPATRRFILDHLAMDEIQWWGMAFRKAVIDAATILGMKAPPSADHVVRAKVNDPREPLDHGIAQRDFRTNPRFTFNLHLTAEKRAVLDALRGAPRLGDFFEVHEGIHSGNMRAELFVESKADDSCEPLYFGRNEIVPYRLEWKGRYVRLGVVPATRSKAKYANVGQPGWHQRSKVLVRRTGDHVVAAVDEDAYYASNNFFLVFPKRESPLDLHGLSALLNSRFMTWYFRAIEPRKGRVFAELKIKHLAVFPLPGTDAQVKRCGELNCLGQERSDVAERLVRASAPHERETIARFGRTLDESIESHVFAMTGLPADLQTAILQSFEKE